MTIWINAFFFLEYSSQTKENESELQPVSPDALESSKEDRALVVVRRQKMNFQRATDKVNQAYYAYGRARGKRQSRNEIEALKAENVRLRTKLAKIGSVIENLWEAYDSE